MKQGHYADKLSFFLYLKILFSFVIQSNNFPNLQGEGCAQFKISFAVCYINTIRFIRSDIPWKGYKTKYDYVREL